MAKALPDHLFCVYMPIDGEIVLLPNSMVEEVLGLDRMTPEASDFMLGYAKWNDDDLAVVSMELLLGRPRPPMERSARLVVVKAISDALPQRRFAFLTQAYPQLVTLSAAAVKQEAFRDSDPDQLILARLSLAGRSALIPDFAEIEARIAAA